MLPVIPLVLMFSPTPANFDASYAAKLLLEQDAIYAVHQDVDADDLFSFSVSSAPNDAPSWEYHFKLQGNKFVVARTIPSAPKTDEAKEFPKIGAMLRLIASNEEAEIEHQCGTVELVTDEHAVSDDFYQSETEVHSFSGPDAGRAMLQSIRNRLRFEQQLLGIEFSGEDLIVQLDDGQWKATTSKEGNILTAKFVEGGSPLETTGYNQTALLSSQLTKGVNFRVTSVADGTVIFDLTNGQTHEFESSNFSWNEYEGCGC